MNRWSVEYSEEVNKWLAKLKDPQAISIAKEVELLSLLGNELYPPHTKALGGGLFELRERAFGLRVYYCFQKGKIILLLCCGNKSSQPRDITRAKARYKELK